MQSALLSLFSFLLLSLTACVCPRRGHGEPQPAPCQPGVCQPNMSATQACEQRLAAIEQRLNDLDRRFHEHQARQQNQPMPGPMTYGPRGQQAPRHAQGRRQAQQREARQSMREVEVRVEGKGAEPELFLFGKPMKVGKSPKAREVEERQVEVRVQRGEDMADDFFLGTPRQAPRPNEEREVKVRMESDANSAELRQLVDQLREQMDQLRAQMKRMRDEQNKQKQG